MISASKKRLLVIDDEQAVCDVVRRVGEAEGFQVVATSTSEEFIASFDAAAPALIFLDLILPDIDGLALLEMLSDRRCKSQIVIMSGTHPELLSSTRRIGLSYELEIIGTLRKPFRANELREALKLYR
jgi:two-component system response regulator AtoC